MWVFLNNAMFSIVEDRKDNGRFVVRSRGKDEIEKVFDVPAIVNQGSDYLYRAFIPRERVEEVMVNELRRIKYDNFKASISYSDKERKYAYGQVWSVMFNFQENQAEDLGIRDYETPWYLNYKDHK